MSKWTPVGTMRRKITIESIDVTPTASGETTDTPIPLITAWALIEPLGGRELFLAKTSQDTSSHRIRMLYQPGITARMRAKYQGRVFNFTNVNNVSENGRELEILAIEVLP